MSLPQDTLDCGVVQGQLSLFDLEQVVHSHLEMMSQNATRGASSNPCATQHPTITRGMGEYLVLLSQSLAQLSEALVRSPCISTAAQQALEESKRKTHCADLSVVACIDVECCKLQKIMEIAARFCEDVREVWELNSISDLDTPAQGYPEKLITVLEKAVKDQCGHYQSNLNADGRAKSIQQENRATNTRWMSRTA